MTVHKGQVPKDCIDKLSNRDTPVPYAHLAALPLGLRRRGCGEEPGVLMYGVVSSQIEKTIDLFATRREAEAFIAEVEADEPDLTDLLSVEEIEVG
jgi:hypothetical protein